MPDTPYRVSKPAAAGARHAAEHAVESARQAARSVATIKEGPLADAAKSNTPDIYIGGNQADPAADVKAIRESHPDTPSFIKAGQPKTWNNKV
jgi:hypothetical protein